MNEMSLHRQWASRPADERFSSLPEMAYARGIAYQSDRVEYEAKAGEILEALA